MKYDLLLFCIIDSKITLELAIESPNKKVFTMTSTRLTKIEIMLQLSQGCSKKFIFLTFITIFCSITNKLQCKIEKNEQKFNFFAKCKKLQ